jgi:hypothetical protein
MFVIVAVAVYGALLGLSTRPAVRAVLVASLSVAAFQCVFIWVSHLLLHRSAMEDLALAIQAYAGSDAKDLIPTVSASAFAAALASALESMTQSSERRRRLRRVPAIED